MKVITSLGTENPINVPPEWKGFFHSSIFINNLKALNDSKHLLVKLIWRLMKESLMIGEFRACRSHVRDVLEAHVKDISVKSSVITDSADAMNYNRVEKICQKKVIDLIDLQEYIATKMYLQMIMFVREALVEPDTNVDDRIFKLWYSIFFCRIWKQHITMRPASHGVFIKSDFITSNAHNCLELNGHELLKILIYCRDVVKKPEMFLVHLLSSQDCEEAFRALRSMGTSNYTSINFTMFELLHKIRRATAMMSLEHDYSIIRKKSELKQQRVLVPTELPSNQRIAEIIKESCIAAVRDLEELGNLIVR